jgi:uncharacterized membrane protein
MMNSTTRQVAAAVAALAGGYLLYIAADNQSNFQTAFTTFWLGLLLFVGDEKSAYRVLTCGRA